MYVFSLDSSLSKNGGFLGAAKRVISPSLREDLVVDFYMSFLDFKTQIPTLYY